MWLFCLLLTLLLTYDLTVTLIKTTPIIQSRFSNSINVYLVPFHLKKKKILIFLLMVFQLKDTNNNLLDMYLKGKCVLTFDKESYTPQHGQLL